MAWYWTDDEPLTDPLPVIQVMVYRAVKPSSSLVTLRLNGVLPLMFPYMEWNKGIPAGYVNTVDQIDPSITPEGFSASLFRAPSTDHLHPIFSVGSNYPMPEIPVAPFTNMDQLWSQHGYVITCPVKWGEITYPFLNFNGCTVEV